MEGKEGVRRLVGGLPDSRPRDQRGQIRTPRGNATPVFCANCGKPAGFAYVSTEFIIFICDACEQAGGALTLPVVDEGCVRGRSTGSPTPTGAGRKEG
jgi:hypothetical protein